MFNVIIDRNSEVQKGCIKYGLYIWLPESTNE
jgi:hypothetical protein